MSVLTVLAAIGIIVYVIGRQVVGGSVTGKRLVVLPAVLTVIGIVNIGESEAHVSATDVVLLALSAVIAIGVGLSLGAMTRIERRDGYLWAQLPKQGLWLWGGLIVSRILIAGVGAVTGAHLVAGSSAILLVLGLNRAAQALVIAPRAISAGIPFAPEKDGSVFASSWFSQSNGHQG
jgi:hypothetical protein